MSFKGRIFNDTWGGRKTATDLIENPLDVLEHIKRQSNWTESGGMPLIDTEAFDSPELDELRGLKVSRQILNANDAYTDNLARSLCESFFMVSRINSAGYETVSALGQPITPDLVPLTLKNSIKSFGRMIEPRLQDVFVEPSIAYGYDHGSGTYLNRMAITNVNAPVWKQEYTPGFNGADGWLLWLDCKAVWGKLKLIEPMPQNLQEQPWIADYDTALWKIRKIVEWMQKPRNEITVGWNRGRLWGVGSYVLVNHPHITGGNNIPAVVEEITKDKRRDNVTVKLVYIESDSIVNPIVVQEYQNTSNTGEDIDEIQNTSNIEYTPPWTVEDADGNVYTTVQIGTQLWTVENWKSTKYADGTAIPNVTVNADWLALTTPAYCWLNNDSAQGYGALYNWYTVDPANAKSIAPTGWRVPTAADWVVLRAFLDPAGTDIWGGNVAGGKMKATGTADWSDPNVGATNSSGFTALPGGHRSGSTGNFSGVGVSNRLWSATERDALVAYYRHLGNGNEYLQLFTDTKRWGFSVRLVRDIADGGAPLTQQIDQTQGI